MRKPLVVANWKMNGSLDENQNWFTMFLSEQTPNIDIVVCPSYPYLQQTQQYLSVTNIAWGVQDISAEPKGAYTGQVSIDMIKDFGAHYVIIGHSERRSSCFEDDELVARKTKLALASGLHPIVCVGETLEQRNANKTQDIVAKQLNTVLELCKNENVSRLVVAYEPVWAIGTGIVATPEQAEDVHSFLRKQLANCISNKLANETRILYGGSVKPDNAKELFEQSNIDGGLIGGASLDATSFMRICIEAKR